MIVQIDEDVLRTIQNRTLADYAGRYLRIGQDFLENVRETGIELAPATGDQILQRRDALLEMGATVRNNSKSVVFNCISSACEACQTGVGSQTFFISLRCHRTCFYCFNPNQMDFDQYRENLRDPAAELQQMYKAGHKLHTLALTGGEPLLYKDKAYEFFRTARRLYPDAHLRLYTCGDHADEATLKELRDAGLTEIRFSIRLHDPETGWRHVYERIALAKQYIPQVMVEMPVFPGTFETMKGILRELDRLGLYSINLLELCYPYFNAEAFRERGFTVKNPPHRVLYDYWYAGGLPIAGSEEVCLDLVQFAIEEGMTMGVHYCSLENKHTGQLYQQNAERKLPATTRFSQHDYFLKSAKAFGPDIKRVQRVFRKQGFKNYVVNDKYKFIEFPVEQIPALQELDIEVGISSSVVEFRGGESYIRELKVDLTTPRQFDLAVDC